MNTPNILRAKYIVKIFEENTNYFTSKKNYQKDLDLYAESVAYLDVMANRAS